MVHNFLDLPLLGQVTDDDTRQGSTDLEALDQDGLGDEAEGGDFLKDTVVRRLVEDDGVLRLVLDLALRPLFLLGGLATP